MKILFSNAPWWDGQPPELRHGTRAGSRWPFTHHAFHMPDQFRFGGYIPFPFFMGYAASFTAREFPEATVSFRDSIARGEGYGAYFAHVRDLRPDWIVIETATPSWPHDEKLLRLYETQVPQAKIIIGGTLDVKQAPAILAAHPNVVAIVRGEYDKQVARVIRGKSGLLEHAMLTQSEMDGAPAPMFDEACALNYWDACPVGQLSPHLQVLTSRGCVYKCSFCVWPAVMTGNDPDGTSKRTVRHYSPEYMEAFIGYRIRLAKKAGTPIRSIYLDDDTFNLGDKHTLAICGVMKKIGLPWSAMCRADTVKRETWQVMKDSGCFGVKIGFESGSQYVIDRIVNKNLDLKKAEETAKFLQSIGLTVHGTFTIGLPGETAEQAQETRDFITRMLAEGTINTHQLSGTAEIEGTPLHTLRERGHLDKYPGAKLDGNYTASPDGQRKIEQMSTAVVLR